MITNQEQMQKERESKAPVQKPKIKVFYENENGVGIVLCHAGFTPWLKEGTFDDISIFHPTFVELLRQYYFCGEKQINR